MSASASTDTLEVRIWHNMPSPHQEDLLRALARRTGAHLRVYYSAPLSKSRASEGWGVTPEGYDYHTFSRRLDVFGVLTAMIKERRHMHIFGGIWSTPNIALAIITARMFGIRYMVMSESPDHPVRSMSRSIAGLARRRLSIAARDALARWIVKRSKGLLAVSSFAESWYANRGMNPAYIYPFGYFKARPQNIDLEWRSYGEDVTFLYVGRRSYAKGLDLLLHALEPLWMINSALRLVVIGKEIDDIRPGQYGLEAKKNGRLVFKEALPFHEVERQMWLSNALILPSRGDGWGMVVVEALMNGLPVIVSDQCGAADLISNGLNGFVFSSGDAGSLRQAINEFLTDGHARSRMSEMAKETGSKLDANNAARYYWECIGHALDHHSEKPRAPWLATVKAPKIRLNS